MSYNRHFSKRQTPQSQPISGSKQVENSAGGYSFQISKWDRLERFLILGADGGTYYTSERELTIENAHCVLNCLEEDGIKTVEMIVESSEKGRGKSNNPALFALSIACADDQRWVRQAAMLAIPRVARTGTHLFIFLNYVQSMRGWGRGLRRAVANWYQSKDEGSVAYQITKYRSRYGWTHRDVFRKAHPNPLTESRSALYHYIAKGWDEIGPEPPEINALKIIWAYEKAKTCSNPADIAELINQFGLSWEMIPTEHLKNPIIWQALLHKMPLHALVRNLGRMTANGAINPMTQQVDQVVSKLSDRELVVKSRLHPLATMVAMKTYQSGSGLRGSLSWLPIPQIVDALEDAFYHGFDAIEPTGKRLLLALDISGSMSYNMIPGLPINAAEASACMAMVTARTERSYAIMGFSNSFIPLPITSRMSLPSVMREISGKPFGRTDCAQPMLWALKERVGVDGFLVYTDNETWAGNIHPSQALVKYREMTGIPAKLVVAGMTATQFSIADPNDSGMMDVVGLDTAAPAIMSNFIRG